MSENRAHILVIDAGNTDTVFGVYMIDAQIATWRIASKLLRTRNDLWHAIDKGLRKKLAARTISGAAISSVVPQLTRLCSSAVRQHLQIIPLVIDGTLEVGLKIRYEQPRSLGPDRLCNAVAAFRRFGGPVIAIDCGTATTYDVVSAKGEYLGGAIAPGIRTAASALSAHTARLPLIDLRFPANAIGSSTVKGMQSGVLFGAIDAMEGMIKRLKKETGPKTRVVLTGGFSQLIASKSTLIDAVEPSLVLDGACQIFLHIHRRRGQ